MAALTARLALGLGECEVASVDPDHAILGVDPSTAGMGAGTAELVGVLIVDDLQEPRKADCTTTLAHRPANLYSSSFVPFNAIGLLLPTGALGQLTFTVPLPLRADLLLPESTSSQPSPCRRHGILATACPYPSLL